VSEPACPRCKRPRYAPNPTDEGWNSPALCRADYAGCDDARHVIECYEVALDAARALVELLLDALGGPHGDHAVGCAVERERACDCGYEALLAAARALLAPERATGGRP